MKPQESREGAFSTGQALVLVLLCTVFLTDLLTQLGFAHGILYLPVLIWAMRLRGKTVTFQKAVLFLSLAGIALGYFLAPAPPEGFPHYYVVANRGLSAAILVFSYFVLKRNLTMKTRFFEVEQKEENQREYLQYFIEYMPIQIWAANPEGQVDFVSGRLVEFTGRARRKYWQIGWLCYIRMIVRLHSKPGHDQWQAANPTGSISGCYVTTAPLFGSKLRQ